MSNLGPFYISESYYRLLQLDPLDGKTLMDGTGSLVTLMAVSGTIDAYAFKGDGSQLTNLNISGSSGYSSSQQVIDALVDQDLVVGTITAEQYVLSSSVTFVTISYRSGSTISGDTLDDVHQFTGSIQVLGSITGSISTSSITNFDTEVSRSVAEAGFGAVPDGTVSSSAQTVNNLLGTNIVSGSGQRSILGLSESDNVTFGDISGSNGTFTGNLYVDGTLTARTYIISSSIINKETIEVSGSTNFGNSMDDRHVYTGSLYVTGSINADEFSGTFLGGVISSSAQIEALGFITSSGTASAVQWDDILNKPNNLVSGSDQRFVLGLAESDSPTFNGMNLTGNLLVAGTITARTFIVSSSIVDITTIYSSGSTNFGDTLDDTHLYTGSMYVTGSLHVPEVSSLPPNPDTGSIAVYQGELYIAV